MLKEFNMESKGYYVQQCSSCGRRVQVQVRYLGMTLTCPHCQKRFVAQDSASIWDMEEEVPEDPHLSSVMQQIKDHLQKSGVLS